MTKYAQTCQLSRANPAIFCLYLEPFQWKSFCLYLEPFYGAEEYQLYLFKTILYQSFPVFCIDDKYLMDCRKILDNFHISIHNTSIFEIDWES